MPPPDPKQRERALADRTTVVRPATPQQLTKLPLTPQEAFVVSRIDRAMSIGDILRVSGLAEGVAQRLLLSLVEKGGLLLPGEGAPGARAGTGAYGSFVFSPGELADAPELDLERKKQILFLFHSLPRLSFFRLLEVSPLAGPADVRRAFLEKSKQFHPDAFFRKELGGFRQKIDTIFQRLKLAHDTLVDEDARARYERENKKLFTPDEETALIQREMDRVEAEMRQSSRRERLMHSRGFGRLTKAREVLAEGDEALSRGDIGTASTAYQLAAELDPKLEEARARLVETRRIGQVRRADLALETAAKAEAEGNPKRAIELLRGASELDPQNVKVQITLARLLLSAGDAKEARVHSQKARDLGELTGEFLLLHAEILIAAGYKKNARRELEIAAERGEEARAKALLKKC